MIIFTFYFTGRFIVGWSTIWCVTGLMAFLHLGLSLVRLIFRCFLRRSTLTTSFHLNFGLPRDVGQSIIKLIIFLVHDVSSCWYKWPDNLFHLRTSSIWWTWILLLRSSVEYFCSISSLLNQRIIAWSHLLIHDKSSTDRASFHFHTEGHFLNNFPWFTRDIPLWVLVEVRGKSSKLTQYKHSKHQCQPLPALWHHQDNRTH